MTHLFSIFKCLSIFNKPNTELVQSSVAEKYQLIVGQSSGRSSALSIINEFQSNLHEPSIIPRGLSKFMPKNLLEDELLRRNIDITDLFNIDILDKVMHIIYRFPPDQVSYIKDQILITDKLKMSLISICNNIGLSSNSFSLYSNDFIQHGCKGTGVLSLINENTDKVLVEVVTFYNGSYGKIITLVAMGLCSTIWFTFVKGDKYITPSEEELPRFVDSLPNFFKPEVYHDKFIKFSFIENPKVNEEIIDIFNNIPPFSGMEIPASGPTMHAVGLGLIIATSIASGIVSVGAGRNIQLIE